jgi:Carboxypeptidase regulatory-like domain
MFTRITIGKIWRRLTHASRMRTLSEAKMQSAGKLTRRFRPSGNAVINFVALALLFAGQCTLARATGSIEGKVTDSSGAPVLGAVVAVQGPDGDSHRTVTDIEGTFQIAPLPPGSYNIRISASGLSDWTASNVPASTTPEAQPLLAVLEVAPSVTTVTVGLSPEEVAEEQVKQEEHQRALGVFPNYFVAYGDHPAPLSTKLKFDLTFKTLIDPMTFTAVGITAGIQQRMNSYYQFGQGSEGFAKRYAAAYGTTATNFLITSAAAESLFHQDPRYFYSGTGTKGQRAWYAVKSAFRTRGDNGKWQAPYAGVTGAIAAAELSDLYYPGSRTQYTLLGRSLMFHFAGLVGLNMAEEFFLKKVTNHTPEHLQAANVPVLREGTPVTLIAVEGFDGKAVAGQKAIFVLAEDLTQGEKVLASSGDVASGLVAQVKTGDTPGAVGSVELGEVTLQAGNVNIPLRSNQLRGAAAPVQHQVLPGSGKIEVKLFVAADVAFPGK